MNINKDEKPYQKSLDAAWDLFSKNKFEEAKKLVNTILKKHPKTINVLALKAHLSFEENYFEESIDIFKNCLNLDVEFKNQGYFHYWIGRVYGNYSFKPNNEIYDDIKANEYYRKAIEGNNYPPDLILRLSKNAKNEKEKTSLLNKGIKEFPGFIDFYINLFNLSKLDNNSQLLSTLQNGFIRTKSYTIIFLIGKYFEKNKNYIQAQNSYIDSLKLITEDSEKQYLYYSLSTQCLAENKIENALKYLENIIEIKSGNISTRLMLQIIFKAIQIKKNELAISLIEKIELNTELFQSNLTYEPIWLENHYVFELDMIIDFKKFESDLRTLRNGIDDELKDKVGLILILILKHNEKHYHRFSLIRQLLNNHCSDYLIEEYESCFMDYSEYIIENKKKTDVFYKNIINDILGNREIRTKIVNSYSMNSLISYLFEEKEYQKISDLGNLFNSSEISKINFWFQLAYSYSEINDIINAKKAYKVDIDNNPESSASYNNLSIILEKEENYAEALGYIIQAKENDPDKKLYERNFNRIKQGLDTKKNKEQKFQEALSFLSKETDYAISRLNNFLKKIKSESSFSDDKLPIANWQFPVLIGANKEIADSLKEQWISKGYIEKTSERRENNVHVYFINPLLEQTLEKISICKIDEKWISGFTSITKETLEEIEYFDNIIRIDNINKKYKEFILRDYKELTINHLLKNEKATLIVAGSLTEFILTYYCEIKGIETITVQNAKGEQTKKKLYDCVLNDLINYFENNSLLKTEFYHLNNLSRIYRNYVHPGKELRDLDGLTMNKAKICFIGVTELMKKILS